MSNKTGDTPISVVIPVRNSPSQLKLCLEGLLKNRLVEVEILVVDDASTDQTAELGPAMAQRATVSLRCLRLGRQSGPALARNEGMRAAQNPFILFLDADIVLPEKGIEWIRETLAQYSCRPEVIGVMGVYSETIPWAGFCANFKNLHICYLHQTTPTVSPYLHTPILCIKKEILEHAGGFDTRLATAEDFRLGVMLGSQGYRFIIDRRVQGTHLKQYSLQSLLKEDWRRIRDLLSIQLDERQQKFIARAHRWTRLLSVALPAPTLAATSLAYYQPLAALIAVFFWLAFYLCNFPFLRYCLGRKGVAFALESAGFLFIEMLWAQVSLAYWITRRALSRWTD